MFIFESAIVMLVLLVAIPLILNAKGKWAAVVLAAIPILAIFVCLFLYYIPLVAEKRRSDNYFAGLDEARSTAPLVGQFRQLFPAADVNYRYFDASGAPGFDLHVVLHRRYELTMQLPVVFDAAARRVVGYGDPLFALVEVQSVQTLPGGQTSISYTASGQRFFGIEEWKKIFASGGDFSAIGYAMKADQPIGGLRIP